MDSTLVFVPLPSILLGLLGPVCAGIYLALVLHRGRRAAPPFAD